MSSVLQTGCVRLMPNLARIDWWEGIHQWEYLVRMVMNLFSS
jgi:hypothetical protein